MKLVALLTSGRGLPFRVVSADPLRGIPREEKTSGAKPYDVGFMFKALILKWLYKLSGQQAVYQTTDRMSCRFAQLVGLNHVSTTI